jgi:hypothetical protein
MAEICPASLAERKLRKREYDIAYRARPENRDRRRRQEARKRSANKEKYKTYMAGYYAANKKKIRAKGVEYRKKNKEKLNAKARALAKLNRARVNACKAAGRALRAKATPAWVNDFFVREAYELAVLRTKLTGIQWDVDHIGSTQVENSVRTSRRAQSSRGASQSKQKKGKSCVA